MPREPKFEEAWCKQKERWYARAPKLLVERGFKERAYFRSRESARLRAAKYRALYDAYSKDPKPVRLARIPGSASQGKRTKARADNRQWRINSKLANGRLVFHFPYYLSPTGKAHKKKCRDVAEFLHYIENTGGENQKNRLEFLIRAALYLKNYSECDRLQRKLDELEVDSRSGRR
jgi:hypothetical protein